MAKSSSSSTVRDAQALIQSLLSTYSATPTNLKIIDLYVIFSAFTALIQFASAFRSTRRTRNSRICPKNVPLLISPCAILRSIW